MALRSYSLSIDGEPLKLKAEARGNVLDMETNGETYRFLFQERGGQVIVSFQGETHLLDVRRIAQNAYEVTNLDGSHEVIIRRKRVPTIRPASSESQRVVVEAPIPGRVVSVNVERGEVVAVGDVLLVLEAMKMQNEIRSPSRGRVAELLVGEGGRVSSRDPLLVLDAI